MTDAARAVACITAVFFIAAGVLHVSAADDHTNLPVMLTGFLLVAVAQAAFGALLVLRRPGRLLLAAGLVLMLGALATWLISRTLGLPFLDGGHMEPIGFKDGVTVLFELAAVPGLLLLFSRDLDRIVVPSPRLGSGAVAYTSAAAFLLLVPALLLGGGEHHSAAQLAAMGGHAHGDDAEVASARAHAHSDGEADHHDEVAAGARRAGHDDHGDATRLAAAQPGDGGHGSAGGHGGSDHGGSPRGDEHGSQRGGHNGDEHGEGGAGGDGPGHAGEEPGHDGADPGHDGADSGHAGDDHHAGGGSEGGDAAMPGSDDPGGFWWGAHRLDYEPARQGGDGEIGTGYAFVYRGPADSDQGTVGHHSDEPCNPTPDQQAAADHLYRETERAMRVYDNNAGRAIADGFTYAFPITDRITHMVNPRRVDDPTILDVREIESFLYVMTDRGLAAVGGMYIMPEAGVPGPQFGGCLTRWHEHAGFAGRLTTAGTQERTPEMLHVWTYPGLSPYAHYDGRSLSQLWGPGSVVPSFCREAGDASDACLP